MRLSIRILAAALLAFHFYDAFASGKLCELIAAGPEAMMKELVRLSATGQKGADYTDLFNAYKTATELSDADLTEAITLQTQMAQVNVSTRRPGEGPASAQDELLAVEAFEYAKDKLLILQAAFMKAIEEANEPVVRGFLTISRQLNNICKDVYGYGRFCKDLDLTKGWDGKDFFLTAVQTSREIALLLAAEDMKVPIEQLEGLQFGPEIAYKFIAEGVPFSFEKATKMKDDGIAMKLLERGDAITSDELKTALARGKKDLFKAALEKYPALASAEASNGSYPLHYATAFGHLDIVELLLKTYKIDVNHRTEKFGPAIFPSVKHEDTKIFFTLLDAGADLKAESTPGYTLLIHAAAHASILESGPVYIRELLLAGLDPNASFNGTIAFATAGSPNLEDLTGNWTPATIAQKQYNRNSSPADTRASKIAEILKQNGAK